MGVANGGFSFTEVDASGSADEAARYLAGVAERAGDARRQGFARLDLGEGSTVLDVGCGLGDVCEDIQRIVGSTGRVVGIDLSAELIDRARERLGESPIRLEVGDAEQLAFDDATFDAVRAERVVQHLKRPATAVAEMARVTKPGGRVLIADAVHDATVIATEHPQVWEAIRTHSVGMIPNPRAGLFLKEWFQDAGLEVDLAIVARVNDDWPFGRMAMRIDAGIANALAADAITNAEADAFTAEQDARFERNEFAQSIFFVHALGHKTE